MEKFHSNSFFDQNGNPDYPRLRKRFKSSFLKYNIKNQDIDDIIQSYLLDLLEKKRAHQTIDQYIIDYLRKEIGNPNNKNYPEKKSFYLGLSLDYIDDVCDIKSYDSFLSVDRDYDLKKILIHFDETSKFIFYSIIKLGYSYVDISKVISMTPTGVRDRFLKDCNKLKLMRL